MDVHVRPARSKDGPALAELARMAYAQYVPRIIGREPAPMTADYAAVIAEHVVWVAEVGGRIVGLLVLQMHADHLLLENVAVAPGFSGMGIGARLLGLAEDHAWQHDILEVRLYTNVVMTENLAYYPRRGYRETHRAIQDGYERVFFNKIIEPGVSLDDR